MVVEMTEYREHIPVMPEKVADLLITDRKGIYVDATLGGGGHARVILDRLDPEASLYGIDQDSSAIQAAGEKIGDDPRFEALFGNFGYLTTLLPPEVHGEVSGILFDLGVSSHQIREPERGFSFQQDGPLDMRMGELSGVSAWQVVNDYSYEKLRDLIFNYGEERKSRPIARKIIESRPVESTGQLRNLIEEVVKGPHTIKSVARVFQAIRIEVNRELEMLKSALEESLDLLRPGGRIVAISYHSLEDRIVKRFFRSGNHEGKIEKDFYGRELAPVRPVIRKIVTPDAEEVDMNPASRSAKLRVTEKAGEVS